MIDQQLLQRIQAETKIQSPPKYNKQSEWDYAVFGSADNGKVVVREGTLAMSPIAIATGFSDEGAFVQNGGTIEELLGDSTEIPDEAKGMVVLGVNGRLINNETDCYVREATLDTVRRELLNRYGGKRVVIETPHAKYYLISLILYIHDRGELNCPQLGIVRRLMPNLGYNTSQGIILPRGL
ncbi:TPA: hypothetical protein HA246_05705 [Candidatus Woesearchaeota archaeon]|nr:hypothetical protein [Candidatus Woesearchaeota archaeon]